MCSRLVSSDEVSSGVFFSDVVSADVVFSDVFFSDVVSADVVEVSPAYDHADITAIAAATIAHDYLVLRAKQKNKQT